MKKFYVLIAASVLFACNSGKNKENNDDSTEISETQMFFQSPKALAVIDSVTGNDRFTLGDIGTAEEWTEETIIETSFKPSPDFLEDYKPLLRYSPDGTKILDLGSYNNMVVTNDKGHKVLEGSEPDTEVSVIDLKTNKKKRLFFSGPSGVIKEGAWLNDSTVFFSGYVDQDGKGKIDTLFWMVNVNSMLFQKFGYKK